MGYGQGQGGDPVEETALGTVRSELEHRLGSLQDQRGALTAERARIDFRLHDVEDAIAAVQAGLMEADHQATTPHPSDPLERAREPQLARALGVR